METWPTRLSEPATHPAKNSSWLLGERLALGGVVGGGVLGDVVVEVGVGEAVDRVGVAGAAWVEGDDVEPVEQLG